MEQLRGKLQHGLTKAMSDGKLDSFLKQAVAEKQSSSSTGISHSDMPPESPQGFSVDQLGADMTPSLVEQVKELVLTLPKRTEALEQQVADLIAENAALRKGL